ncbi:hypothetical protein MANES_05G108300v8 [Manihot esculenta]|uniref:Uncharacterized protein n=1 Tax=Manihot esculenta TaxID=3983 RepID=A0ACB7HN69_MANES|nr:hypothetical protein MANES_05G108300v8 [Manihot esculenta]
MFADLLFQIFIIFVHGSLALHLNPLFYRFLPSLYPLCLPFHFPSTPLSPSSPPPSAVMSCNSRLLISTLLLLLLLLLVTSAARLPNPTSSSSSFQSSSRDHHFYRQPPSCASFPHKTTSRYLCIHFQRMNPQRLLAPPPPPTPPSSLGEEIDPRYGVEKRLVPSGPNPLHN